MVHADEFFVHTKLLLKVNNDLWARVVSYQVEKGLKNRNLAVQELLVLGLETVKEQKLLTAANRH